jgi:cytidylate kinase
VVFPKAQVKLFVTASPAERARRRHAEMLARGQPATLAEVEAEMAARDARDAGRDVAPLAPGADARLLDTTLLDPDAAFAAGAAHHRLALRLGFFSVSA